MQHLLHRPRIRGLLATALLGLMPLAHAEVVVIAKNATSLSKEQIADIFLGKNTSLSPIDLPEASPARDEFYTKVTGKSAAQAKAHWSKLAFTGKGTPPKEASSSADVKKMVASSDNAVGYIEKSAVDGSVKVLYTAQ